MSQRLARKQTFPLFSQVRHKVCSSYKYGPNWADTFDPSLRRLAIMSCSLDNSNQTFNLVELLLEKQQDQSAIEAFSQWHDDVDESLHARVYRDLIPVMELSENEQYAFEVDLDACSGCKSCVVACHNLNGLEEGENWRSVGIILGGNTDQPLLQHVTTSCHHCLEPSCLEGCPANAYAKDPINGIVRHLDDQCIGCQYCIFKCPYDVPQYSPSKGIVRKCDMCYDRIAGQEAPACVQSCPNHAIRITVTKTDDIIKDSETNQFLPTAPQPEYTLPSTRFVTSRPFPRNTLSPDFFQDQPQHPHWPLVIMLVLTQLSVGSFMIHQYFSSVLGICQASEETIRSYDIFHSKLGTTPLLAVLLLGFIGMGASVFHLGRPFYAFRAILGIRRSWLSREIVAFGAFAFFATSYAVSQFVAPNTSAVSSLFSTATTLFGMIGVVASILVYVNTPRDTWNPFYTSSRFLLTAVVMGLPTTIMILSALTLFSNELNFGTVMQDYSTPIALGTLVSTALKLGLESLALTHLRQKRLTPNRRTALLLTTRLLGPLLFRFGIGILGGILLPLILLTQPVVTAGTGFNPLFYLTITILSWCCLLAGELTERYLFFTSVTTQRMPGTSA